ncbi:hypothetical protein V1477_010956 [Vespula maculifrons]|uniref:Uncharacterized protein n=1 Tax=Vespula maculifrons TaxID=7453 RepID=A0ABD2C3F2_VESMC
MHNDLMLLYVFKCQGICVKIGLRDCRICSYSGHKHHIIYISNNGPNPNAYESSDSLYSTKKLKVSLLFLRLIFNLKLWNGKRTTMA